MRRLDCIVLHYTATPPDMDIGVDEVWEWHRGRGFTDVGYHFLVRLDGTRELGRPVDVPGAHCKGHNANTIGVCYVGGGEGEDTRTPAQKEELTKLIGELRSQFGPIPVRGHRDMPGAATCCPGFDPSKEYN